MFRVTAVLLCFSISLKASTASLQHSGKYCPQSCEAILNYVTFNDTDAALSRKVHYCRSQLRTTSLYLCFELFCHDDGEPARWIDNQGSWCSKHAGIQLPDYHEVVDSWTPDAIATIRRFKYEEAQAFPTLDILVLPDDDFFESAFSTLEAAFYEYDIHLVYGLYMIYFWVIVIAIGVSARLLGLIRILGVRNLGYKPISNDHEASRIPSKTQTASSLPSLWLKRFLTTPALLDNRCSQPYGWCTIPARAQSLTIFVFVVLNVVACVGNYRLTDGNIYWPEKSAQLLRYASDRTGIVSLANFPLIWLFGMRNDVLLWLTGWGFGTFNAFHRWVARVATVEAVVHSLGYTLMICESGGWHGFLRYWTKHYFWNGELSTIAMCALLAFSFYGIRRAHYEIFLMTHIVLSVVALWTMYYHVEIFTDGEWNVFIWPCLAIWLLDRTLRVVRILLFDWHFWGTRAKICYDPKSDLIKMEVPTTRCFIKSTMLKPGSYFYIYDLSNPFYAHQNHPFTMAYISCADNEAPSTPLRSLHQRGDSSESDSLLDNNPMASSSIVFLVRPYDGFTARLRSECLSHRTSIPVFIEGPYGHSEALHTFDNVLFIVGGTGVAVPLSHLASLLSPESVVQSVKIVWAVRQHAFLAFILDDFKGILADERLEMEVHVTRRDEAYDDVLGQDLRNVRLMTGRPDVCRSVLEAAKEANQQPLATVACGPAPMADETRKAVVAMLAAGHLGIEYFEESFKW